VGLEANATGSTLSFKGSQRTKKGRREKRRDGGFVSRVKSITVPTKGNNGPLGKPLGPLIGKRLGNSE